MVSRSKTCRKHSLSHADEERGRNVPWPRNSTKDHTSGRWHVPSSTNTRLNWPSRRRCVSADHGTEAGRSPLSSLLSCSSLLPSLVCSPCFPLRLHRREVCLWEQQHRNSRCPSTAVEEAA